MFYRLTSIFIVCYFTFSCSPISNRALTKTFKATETNFQDHTGFVLYDPETKKEVYSYNGDKYFTPASNTKILTLYTSLNILGDSIPALRFVTRNDSLIFWGTGDPSFLYKNVFSNKRCFDFLKTSPYKLYFSASNFQSTHFGPGWAWDDYNDYYSAERSSFPIYGNIFSVREQSDGIVVQPKFFSGCLEKVSSLEKSSVKRDLSSNQVIYNAGVNIKHKTWDVPFKTDPQLTATLLADTLKKEITLVNVQLPAKTDVLYSVPADSLYKVMMQQSDNFIAEQLLLICAGVISDTLKPEIAIRYARKFLLNDLQDNPAWVDGSGLSRYNLITPRTVVQLWRKIYDRVPSQKLFSLLAIGGKPGTLQNWYKEEVPYLYGKTGTLSNNHNLSGYLLTKKGNVLIFSFMSNNYVCSTNEIRKNMEKIINELRHHL